MARGDSVVDIGSMIMMPEMLLMKKELADELDNNIKMFKGKVMGEQFASKDRHAFKYSNLLRSYLERAGLKENNDYTIVEYPDPGKELSDLVAQKIQIAKVFPPMDVQFLRTHPDFARVPFAKVFPYLPCCRQLVTRAQLKENRPKYVRLLRASIRAHKFVFQHPREAAEVIAKALGVSPSEVRQSIMSSWVSLTPDPMRKGVELYQRANDKFTGTKTATAEYIDTSLYRDALLGLAKESEDPESQGYYNTMISRYRANN
jgi:ABC-type nitrate/sulfonate/bicarbonate transport system substrate-binding protein